jgi:Leucine-rich repeat (LRR) protein
MTLYKNLNTALKERENVSQLKISVKDSKFPMELLDFPNLTELYLEGECEKLPDQLNGWSRVKILSVKWTNFKGDLSPLFSLPCLENLKIIETPMKRFLLPLGKVAAPLKVLNVKSCGLEVLPEEISMLTQLTELALPHNALTRLPHSFSDLRYLKRLNLDANSFSNFPDFIKKMKTLSHLSIDGNKFSDDEKDRIQREFNIWVS